MSIERLNRNFQNFLQSIYHWPTPTIEKSVLIQKLEELCRHNPELRHIYENVPLLGIIDPSLTQQTDDHYQLETKEYDSYQPTIQTDIKPLNNNNDQVNINETSTAQKESNPLPDIIVFKEGELTVRKGSTVLSPLLKKLKLKSTVYYELSYTFCDGEKLVYLIVYQSRKCRTVVYRFTIDDTCSIIFENNKDFQFKHNSVVENFTTEPGVVNTWIAFFNEISVRENPDDEDVYENPDDYDTDDFDSSSESSVDYLIETPTRPPPRPFQPTNSISPENIYVCLYDHYSTTNDSNELEFSCGDLLYILNNDGPNFYIGHRLVLPLNNHFQAPIGFVFKDYIKPAYEKV